MRIDVECTTKSLGAAHGPRGSADHAHALLGHALDLFGEDAIERAEHVGPRGRKPTQLPGQGENPLPDRHEGPDAINELRRLVAHPAGAAAGANPSRLARERHKHIVAAPVAMAT